MSVKLKHLDNDNSRRREIAKFYRENIKNDIVKLPEIYDEMAHVWHLFVVRVDNQEKFRQYLLDNDIQSAIHYPIPPHKQEHNKAFSHLLLPISEKLHKTVVSIPMSPVLEDFEIEEVIKVINKYK